MYRATLLYTLLLVHLLITPAVILALANPPLAAVAEVHVDQALEEIHTRFTRSANRTSTIKKVAAGAAIGAAAGLAAAGAAKLYDHYKHRNDGTGHGHHGSSGPGQSAANSNSGSDQHSLSHQHQH